jgi:hypothetical protein
MREAVRTNGTSPKKSNSAAVSFSKDQSGEEQSSKQAQLILLK